MTGGRSAVTGKIVPFNQMQLDHHVPYSSAATAVKDKKKKGIKTDIKIEKAKLDSAPNWDLMETELNQFKNSLEGNALIAKATEVFVIDPRASKIDAKRSATKIFSDIPTIVGVAENWKIESQLIELDGWNEPAVAQTIAANLPLSSELKLANIVSSFSSNILLISSSIAS